MVLMVRPPALGPAPPDDNSARLQVRTAAMPLFAEHGYAGTSVDAIASASGISRRTFFRLFEGKHQVVSCDHALFHNHVVDSLAGQERTPLGAAKALSCVLTGFSADPKTTALRSTLVRSETLLQAEELRWSTQYRATIARFLTGGGTTALHAEYIAAGLLGLSEKVLRDWIDAPHATDPATTFITAAQDTSPPHTYRRVLLIDTDLTPDEIDHRLHH